MNLYAFVHNDPLTHLDLYGLWGTPSMDQMKGWGWGALGWANEGIRNTGFALTMMGAYAGDKPLLSVNQIDRWSQQFTKPATRWTTQGFANICPPAWGSPDFALGKTQGYWATELGFIIANGGGNLAKGAFFKGVS